MMSTLVELTIQGIRSFGTKAADKQQIQFSSPVTLIIGENGCGKTTIIECIKYALIGEAPPGSNRGQHFVHDPTIFDFSESLGQIQLRVKNIRGEVRTICRSMKMSYKRGKLVFATLDAIMSYGKDCWISRNCVDVDLAMSEFMGVSEAIINNVLFCHQEDSSWPLEEPKKLKEKFDAIFGITEYNKAIDKFIKMRKDEINNLKLKESNLKYLSHLKNEMEDKTIDLQSAHAKYLKAQKHCDKLDEEIKPIDDRLLAIRKVEYEVGKQQAMKVEVETKLKNCHDQITKLTKKIKQIFEGTIQQLDLEILAFGEKMHEKRLDQQEQEHSLAFFVSKEKGFQTAISELDRRLCTLMQRRQKELENTAERAEKMRTLCGDLGIHVDVDLAERVPKVLENIKQSMEAKEEQIKETQVGHEKADYEKQFQIDELRVQKAKIETDIEGMQKQKNESELKLQKIEREIADYEGSTHQLKEFNERIASIDEVYEKTLKSLKQEELKNFITEKKANVIRLEDRFRTLDTQLTRLNSTSKLVAEINLKEKHLERKELEVRRIKSKQSDNLKKVLERPIESNYKRTVQIAYEKFQRQIKELTAKINDFKLKEQVLEIKRKAQKDELTCWEKELTDANDSIYEKCHSTPYEELLAKSKETVSKYQLEHGSLKSSEAMYNKYIKKIEEDPQCPLCHSEMSEGEAALLTTELLDEIHLLPENINRTEKLLNAEQNEYEALIQLRTMIDKVQRLEKDIPSRKAELKLIEEKLVEVSNDAESCRITQTEPSVNLEIVNCMLGDMSLLDEAIREVARLQGDLGNLKSKLSEGRTSDSIDEVQLEKTTVSAEWESERNILEKKQTDYERGNDTLNNLREERNKLKDATIKLQAGVQSLPQLNERKTELNKQIDANANQITTLLYQLQPLKQLLTTTIEEKQSSKEENRKIVVQMQAKLDSMRNLDHDTQRLNRELLELAKLNLAERIECLKTLKNHYKDESTVKLNEIAKLSQDLEATKIEVHKQDSLERDLNDNRELKELQQLSTKLDEEQSELTILLVELDFQRVNEEKEELIKKRDQATVRKGELLGQIGEINNQINKLKREIDEPKYKDLLQNYRRNFYDVEVTKRVIADLGQYRIAVEWAVLKFHAEKMYKINCLIREYWRQIYRGNDIDYIQIQTDEMKVDASADRKRSYNYRVVQSKNNTEIEMRGRCSAGQRVLASLIIRMALAETFCCNCGVLALDEPTANLDEANIHSMCEALNRIVEERKTINSSMLIVITHDEKFISWLGKNGYYKVLRNNAGKSVIMKTEVVPANL